MTAGLYLDADHEIAQQADLADLTGVSRKERIGSSRPTAKLWDFSQAQWPIWRAKARTSSISKSGRSMAAKWPPEGMSVQRTTL